MGTTKKAVYKVHNGVDFDEIYFKTSADMVENLATDANKTYYISNAGSDSNNGLTSGTPFKTVTRLIQEINKYSIINHDVHIKVLNNVVEDFSLTNVVGTGRVYIEGVDPSVSGLNSVYFSSILCRVLLQDIDIKTTAKTAIEVSNCPNFYAQNASAENNASTQNAVRATNSNVILNKCKLANKDVAIFATENSKVYVEACTGTGNKIGYYADKNADISVNGGTLTGTTLKLTASGGAIRGI